MNGLPYFAFYANDFVGGVKLFTTEEVGAYMLLLCYQWTNGPLPKDQADLDRIAGATVSQRVRNKFRDTLEGLVNSRLEVERVRGIAKKKSAMDRLHRHRKNKKSETRFNGVAKPVAQRFRSDSDSHTTVGSMDAPVKTKPKRKTKAEHAASYAPDIAAIVMAYPKVNSPQEANEVWRRMANRPTLELILAKIEENKKWNKNWKDGFIPDLVVWLNQKRWEGKIVPDTLLLAPEDPNAAF